MDNLKSTSNLNDFAQNFCENNGITDAQLINSSTFWFDELPQAMDTGAVTSDKEDVINSGGECSFRELWEPLSSGKSFKKQTKQEVQEAQVKTRRDTMLEL